MLTLSQKVGEYKALAGGARSTAPAAAWAASSGAADTMRCRQLWILCEKDTRALSAVALPAHGLHICNPIHLQPSEGNLDEKPADSAFQVHRAQRVGPLFVRARSVSRRFFVVLLQGTERGASMYNIMLLALHSYVFINVHRAQTKALTHFGVSLKPTPITWRTDLDL